MLQVREREDIILRAFRNRNNIYCCNDGMCHLVRIQSDSHGGKEGEVTGRSSR